MDQLKPTPSATASAKASPSDDAAFDILVMRKSLDAAKRLRPDMTEEELKEAYARLQADQAEAVILAKGRREREARERAHAQVLESLRIALRGFHVDPDGMDEAEMRERLKPLQEEHERVMAQRQEEQRVEARRRRAEQLMRAADCPERHVSNLDKIDAGRHPKWLAYRDLLVEQAGYARGYLVGLLGISGTGKTQMATSVIHRCAGQLLTCRYVKALKLFAEIRKAYTPVARGESGVSDDDLIDRFAKYDLLVIDEAHQRAESIFETNTLISLLDRRYDARKCTIMIANQDRQAFAESVGDSIVSRIHEAGEVLTCDWPTFRKPGGWREAEGALKRIPSGIPSNNSVRFAV